MGNEEYNDNMITTDNILMNKLFYNYIIINKTFTKNSNIV